MFYMKKLIAVILTVTLVIVSVPVLSVTSASSAALKAEALGLLIGAGSGVSEAYLSASTTRAQGAAILLRLMGKEEEAKAYQGINNFSDVIGNEWYAPLLAYLKVHPELGFVGYPDGSFKPLAIMTAAEFKKVLLTCLGYRQDIDYTWFNVMSKSEAVGLTRYEQAAKHLINHDIASLMMDSTVLLKKGSSLSLVEYLIGEGVIDAKIASDLGLISMLKIITAVRIDEYSLKVVFNMPVEAGTLFTLKKGFTTVYPITTYQKSATEAILTHTLPYEKGYYQLMADSQMMYELYIGELVSDYFPIRVNTAYYYEGTGNEYATYEMRTDYTTAHSLQQRINNGGTVVARVIRIEKGEAAVTFNRGETYFMEDFTDKSAGATEILLKEPIVAGNSWILSDGRTRTITRVNVTASVPIGTYQAVEVTTRGEYSTVTDYYVKGIGLIKTVFVSDESPADMVVSALQRIETNVPHRQTISFYYPDVDTGIYHYRNVEIHFWTNSVAKNLLTEAYRYTPPGFASIFSVDTMINTLSLIDDTMMKIDLNQSFVSDMNAGSSAESMILQSVVNTFGQYYGVEKVLLTINGQPYESGHFLLMPGEYLVVRLDKTAPLE